MDRQTPHEGIGRAMHRHSEAYISTQLTSNELLLVLVNIWVLQTYNNSSAKFYSFS